jgi:hypothetical protein
MRRLEELTGNLITEAALRDAIRLMNRERKLRRAVARMAGRGLSGREVLESKSLISGIPEDLAPTRGSSPRPRPWPEPTFGPGADDGSSGPRRRESFGYHRGRARGGPGELYRLLIEEDVAKRGPVEALARK